MKKSLFLYLFFSIWSLMLFACNNDLPQPIASIPTATIVPTQTPSPTAEMLPTATSAPTQTADLTAKPTDLPIIEELSLSPTFIPSRTPIPPTPTNPPPTATAPPTRPSPVLEWIPPRTRPENLVSISGGILAGFEVERNYTFAILGSSVAVIDTNTAPAATELYRISLSGRVISYARSGRFMFVQTSEQISVIDITDPLAVREVARITGLGDGRIEKGSEGQIYFVGPAGWWQLDVDQALPAERLDSRPGLADREEYDQAFWQLHGEGIQAQLDLISPRAYFWFPSAFKPINGDLLYSTATGGEAGGGQIVRLDMSDPDNPQVKSVFRTFTLHQMVYNKNQLFVGFSGETAGELSRIDVQDVAQPRFVEAIPASSRAVFIRGGIAYTGRYPGMSVVDLADVTKPTVEVEAPFNGSNSYQFLGDPDRPLIYALGGLYEPNGIAVFSIQNRQKPALLSDFMISGPFQIRYHAERLYGFVSGFDGVNPQVVILDAADPTNLDRLATWPLDDVPVGLQAWSQGEQVLVALLTVSNGLQFWDASEPSDPVLLGQLDYPERCQLDPTSVRYGLVRDVLVVNDRLFAQLGGCGTFEIGVSDVGNPVVVQEFPAAGPLVFADDHLFIGGNNLHIFQVD